MFPRRSWRAAAAAAVLALVFATPAAAKMSYFSVELDASDPVVGEPITVTVRLWDDAAHSLPATWGPPGGVDDLLAFVPADGRSRDWIYVPLESVGDSEMRGTVTLPFEGEWTLTPWPHATDLESVPGYPEPVTVDVARPFDPAPVATLGVLGIGWLAAALFAFLRRRPRTATNLAKSSSTER